MNEEAELDPKTLLWLLLGHVRDRVVTHPVTTLGGAAMVGYVLGWSLPRPLLRMGAAVLLRAALVEALEELLGPLPEDEPGVSRRPVEVHPGAGPSGGMGRQQTADPYVA